MNAEDLRKGIVILCICIFISLMLTQNSLAKEKGVSIEILRDDFRDDRIGSLCSQIHDELVELYNDEQYKNGIATLIKAYEKDVKIRLICLESDVPLTYVEEKDRKRYVSDEIGLLIGEVYEDIGHVTGIDHIIVKKKNGVLADDGEKNFLNLIERNDELTKLFLKINYGIGYIFSDVLLDFEADCIRDIQSYHSEVLMALQNSPTIIGSQKEENTPKTLKPDLFITFDDDFKRVFELISATNYWDGNTLIKTPVIVLHKEGEIIDYDSLYNFINGIDRDLNIVYYLSGKDRLSTNRVQSTLSSITNKQINSYFINSDENSIDSIDFSELNLKRRIKYCIDFEGTENKYFDYKFSIVSAIYASRNGGFVSFENEDCGVIIKASETEYNRMLEELSFTSENLVLYNSYDIHFHDLYTVEGCNLRDFNRFRTSAGDISETYSRDSLNVPFLGIIRKAFPIDVFYNETMLYHFKKPSQCSSEYTELLQKLRGLNPCILDGILFGLPNKTNPEKMKKYLEFKTLDDTDIFKKIVDTVTNKMFQTSEKYPHLLTKLDPEYVLYIVSNPYTIPHRVNIWSYPLSSLVLDYYSNDKTNGNNILCSDLYHFAFEQEIKNEIDVRTEISSAILRILEEEPQKNTGWFFGISETDTNILILKNLFYELANPTKLVSSMYGPEITMSFGGPFISKMYSLKEFSSYDNLYKYAYQTLLFDLLLNIGLPYNSKGPTTVLDEYLNTLSDTKNYLFYEMVLSDDYNKYNKYFCKDEYCIPVGIAESPYEYSNNIISHSVFPSPGIKIEESTLKKSATSQVIPFESSIMFVDAHGSPSSIFFNPNDPSSELLGPQFDGNIISKLSDQWPLVIASSCLIADYYSIINISKNEYALDFSPINYFIRGGSYSISSSIKSVTVTLLNNLGSENEDATLSILDSDIYMLLDDTIVTGGDVAKKWKIAVSSQAPDINYEDLDSDVKKIVRAKTVSELNYKSLNLFIGDPAVKIKPSEKLGFISDIYFTTTQIEKTKVFNFFERLLDSLERGRGETVSVSREELEEIKKIILSSKPFYYDTFFDGLIQDYGEFIIIELPDYSGGTRQVHISIS